MTRVVRSLAWVLLAVAVWLVVQVRGGTDTERGAPPERLLAYRLDRPLYLSAESQEQTLRLVTWLSVAPDRGQDTRRALHYALKLSFTTHRGRQVWEDEVWVTGLPQWVDDGTGILGRGAWLDGIDDRMLTAHNTTDVQVADLSASGGVLRVEVLSAPPDTEVLGVAFRAGDRPTGARYRVQVGDDARLRDGLAARLGPLPWSVLPAPWRDELATARWERLGALPATDVPAPETVELLTRFARQQRDRAGLIGLPVMPGGAVAFNVSARSRLVATWHALDGTPIDAPGATLRLVSADGSHTLTELGAGKAIGPLELEGPLTSVQLALSDDAPGPLRLRATLYGLGDDPSWGDPPRTPGATPWTWEIAPDLRTLEAWRTGPEAQPLRFPVTELEQARITVRQRLDGDTTRGPGLSPAAPMDRGLVVQVQAQDAAGTALGSWSMPVAAAVSPFERYVADDDLTQAWVSEPVRRYVVPPAGTRSLVVTANRTADVSVRVLADDALGVVAERRYVLPETTRAATPGADAVLADHDADGDAAARTRRPGRYAPAVRDTWIARDPQDTDALMAARQFVRIDAQVRLDPAERHAGPVVPDPAEGDGVSWGPQRTLPLPGAFALLAEADRDGLPTASAHTRLSARARTVVIPASGRLDIAHRTAVDQVGRTVSVRVGNETRTRQLRSAGGRVRLDGLTPGPAQVAVDAPGLWLADARGAPAWNVRRVVPVAPGQVLTVPLPAQRGALSLYPYLGPEHADDPGTGGLYWRIDTDEAPAGGLVAQLTRREGVVPLDPIGVAAAWLSRAAGAVDQGRLGRIQLGDDLGEATGTVRIWTEGTDHVVWLRLTATWPEGIEKAPVHWQTRVER